MTAKPEGTTLVLVGASQARALAEHLQNRGDGRPGQPQVGSKHQLS